MLKKVMRAFAPIRMARYQNYWRHEQFTPPPATKTISPVNAILADSDVTLAGGIEMREENIDALRGEIAKHKFGKCFGL